MNPVRISKSILRYLKEKSRAKPTLKILKPYTIEGMYRLFSRRVGWPGGEDVKYFATNIVDGDPEVLKTLVGRSGRYILNITKEKKIEIPDSFAELCRIYDTWYLYEADTIITSGVSD